MIQIFPFGSDDEFAMRCNAAVTIVAHAAKQRVSGPLNPILRGPFEQLMLVWDMIPSDLIASFTRAYGEWDHEREAQRHPNPRIEAAAIEACTYAAAIVSLINVQLEMERRRLMREQQELVEEFRRRTGGR